MIDDYMCPKCNRKSTIRRSINFTTVGDYLIINLLKEESRHIKVESILKFQHENEIPHEFELVGAVIYHTRMKQSGHYTYVSRDIDTNRIWHYNDEVVKDESEKGDLESYLTCL